MELWPERGRPAAHSTPFSDPAHPAGQQPRRQVDVCFLQHRLSAWPSIVLYVGWGPLFPEGWELSGGSVQSRQEKAPRLPGWVPQR